MGNREASALEITSRVRLLLERIERALHIPGVHLRGSSETDLRLAERYLADVWNKSLANAWSAHVAGQPEVPPESAPVAPKVQPPVSIEQNYWLDRMTNADAPAK